MLPLVSCNRCANRYLCELWLGTGVTSSSDCGHQCSKIASEAMLLLSIDGKCWTLFFTHV